MKKFILKPGQLTLTDIRFIINNEVHLELDPISLTRIHQSRQVVKNVLDQEQAVYGINTGFGQLANVSIDKKKLALLQHNLLLSHAVGTGELLADSIVKLILLLKVNSLACGYSGIRLILLEALIALFNHRVYPAIPAKGSVGASGDLAPLAHLSLTLIGVGHARAQGKLLPATEALAIAKISPLSLAAKEGLALINGTQVSTALAIYHLLQTEKIFSGGLISGAMSLDAALGSDTPFDEKIHQIRKHSAQIVVAKLLRELLKDSEIRRSHEYCNRVQDPYSLRCQPQVMGACLMNLQHAAKILVDEANAVTDNPLVFSAENQILSGGNFHAEPVAIVADLIAICVAEIGAISERRIALLVDKTLNGGLPAFLIKDAGINSGFMVAQYTAAALASENKTLAHPASLDSIPTCANQEDHVSMATFAARRLAEIIDNVNGILAIELLAACQGVELRAPLKTSPALQTYHQQVRKLVAFYTEDRYFAPDIALIKEFLYTNIGILSPLTEEKLC
ncbi:MAG: histidine ammonia-lyase [Gammaproteobacteria bacterium RIFCSPHIGHO2_12_FULL_35_23]|nr:MAG: histidine ammonia-lyase [Gammaproteobacteria bacterium RIFCSPHIGHO2_12_FULL_35_23]